MPKIHFNSKLFDARAQGQTEFEYNHQTLCGYVRDNVTTDREKVMCFYCNGQLNREKRYFI